MFDRPSYVKLDIEELQQHVRELIEATIPDLHHSIDWGIVVDILLNEDILKYEPVTIGGFMTVPDHYGQYQILEMLERLGVLVTEDDDYDEVLQDHWEEIDYIVDLEHSALMDMFGEVADEHFPEGMFIYMGSQPDVGNYGIHLAIDEDITDRLAVAQHKSKGGLIIAMDLRPLGWLEVQHNGKRDEWEFVKFHQPDEWKTVMRGAK